MNSHTRFWLCFSRMGCISSCDMIWMLSTSLFGMRWRWDEMSALCSMLIWAFTFFVFLTFFDIILVFIILSCFLLAYFIFGSVVAMNEMNECMNIILFWIPRRDIYRIFWLDVSLCTCFFLSFSAGKCHRMNPYVFEDCQVVSGCCWIIGLIPYSFKCCICHYNSQFLCPKVTMYHF